MASIKDVAREARVSIATVSRVYNNPEIVSEKTKKRVYLVARKLGYTPNFLAQNLRKSIVGTIIATIPDMSNAFFIDMVRGIQDYAESRGYNVLMGRFDPEHFDIRKYVRIVKSKAADGIVLATGHNRYFDPIEEARGIPLVSIEEEFMGNPHIYVDNSEAIKKIIDYLISKNRQKINFLGFKTEIERARAFEKIIKEKGLEYKKSTIWKCDEEEEKIPQHTKEYVDFLVEQGNLPDAIVCASDLLAAGTIKWLAKRGINIPGDVAVTGFDNTEIAALFNPGITTIEQPCKSMGREAARLLINKIEGHEIAKKVAFQTKIIIRESA
ncbi:LacI family DNA-binding transcriptional regulator [Mesoaciditoga lauensis]|uniref:LacI family DNA-binding transcriptional regulator n=1 Tax=Mesoaciditoga lauensis TaxID=1495039 RepID=UPI00055ACBA4|nr:LacI family DNA-binding transcriptional regulator [Mesoaciditoga lauensis]